jgi:hypothetical protein
VRYGFSGNSIEYVKSLVATWGVNVRPVQAEIVGMLAHRLPADISCALIDVDLYDPTLAALQKVLPRMVNGGRILVDDCDDNGIFSGARQAYIDFCDRIGIPASYRFGMGLIER